MMRTLFVLVLCVAALADQLVWTGLGNTSVWDDYRNWDRKRIPTPDDDIIIDLASAVVTLDVNWGTVRSMHISAGMFIQPQNFGVGRLTVDNNGVYRLDSGNGALTVGTANVTSTQGFLFASGTITGALIVSSNSILNFTGAGAKSFNLAKVTASGNSVCDAGATINFNGSTINFAGGLTINSGDAVNFMGIGGTNQITGAGILAARAGLQLLVGTSFNTLNMGANSQLTITKEQQQVGSLIMDDSSAISIAGENTALSAGSITSRGVISTLSPISVGGKSQIRTLVIDGAAPVVFGSAVAFGQVTIKSGSMQISGMSTADQAQFGVATVTGVGSLSIGDLRVTGPNMNLANASINVTGTANFNGQIQLSSGLVAILNGATANVVNLQVLAAGGIAVPGISFINQGKITITQTQLSFTQLNAGGRGTYVLDEQTQLTLSNANMSAASVVLGDGAEFSGPVAGIDVVSTTAQSQKYVDFTVNGFTFHCTSPCPPITSSGQTSFSAVAASS